MVRPNWFIAFPADAELVLPPPPDRVRLFAAKDLHLTAAFLGGVSRETAHAAWALCQDMELAPITVRLAEVRLLGGRRPTAVAAVPDNGFDAAAAHMAAVQAPLVAAGHLAPEGRNPLPHVTLARIHRRASPVHRRHAEDWSRTLGLESQVRLSRLALYTWSEDRSDHLFRIVQERRL